MIAYKQRNKDRFVRIYVQCEEQLPDGSTVRKRVYIHGPDSGLKAYVRSLSASERNQSNQTQPDNRIEVTINYRRFLENRQDAYLEFDGKTYAITGIDPLEFKNTEMKLTCSSVSPPRVDSVEYMGKECDCGCEW